MKMIGESDDNYKARQSDKDRKNREKLAKEKEERAKGNSK